MANKSLHTNQVTFMDLTDDRKLEVYITSTLPITQIKDSNTGEYTPDWSATTLELSADIYLDSIDVTNNQNTTIVWYEQIGAGTKTQVPNSAYIDGRPTSIMINANKMTNDAMVTYSCEAIYQNTTAHDKLTFTRVDTGRNGADGKDGTSAPAVQAQYSADGLSGWTFVLNTVTHKYIRFSYDSGKTWTVAIKMVGENGTSVSIKGTATARYTVDGTPYYTLAYNSTTITDTSLGDSYLYGGDLYVCIDDSLAHFMYVGQIQGPKGNDGQSSYVYVMYAADTSGTGMTKNPSSTTTHIGVCVSAATSAPTTASSYTWSKFVGDSAKSIILNGTSQIFKVTNSSPVAYLPTSITITAQAINITIAKWEYSVNGGVNWTTITESNNLSGIVLNSTNNTISITGADMTSNSIVVRASNGVYSDTYTVYKVFDGKGVASITEQYYQSTSATTQSGGSWSNTVPTWANGKYIWTRSVITYTDATTSTTSPICVTGQTGGIGDTGVGISSIDVWYYQSTSATALSGGSWSTTAPTWSDGKYIWTKTITTYTNNTTDETAAVCITGQKGSTGVGVKSITEYYLATSSNSGVTTDTAGWTTAVQTITADKKYLWNYETITYTDNTTSTTSPIIIGAFGNTGSTGATGKGIKSVTEYYLATTASSGVTTSTTGWKDTMQSLTATNKYLWNYELITYTDNTTATIDPVIIGVYGDKGVQGDRGAGISSVTVTYGTSTSASTQPTSWQTTLPVVADGSYLWTRTVTDYTDASIADTVTLTYAKQGDKGNTGSAGTSVAVSSIQYQAGTSATTAPTGTWSNSVVTVAEGNYLWTKTTFSDGKVAYGVAKQGAKGSAGADAYTVILTNESHVFAGNVSSAIASSATTQVMAYKGSTSQSVTIVSVDGKTASTSSTATSITGLSFVCSALSGTTPTITFTCTTSFVSPSGTIPIVVKVDGVTITKMFTYGIAFKGATGSQGTTGTAASLVDITPSAHYFKSTTGKDGTFTPDYIYLYPRFQTVTFSKWEYSINGGANWIAASGANGISIGTYNSIGNTLRLARTSTLYTDTITSISFRCVSSNASVYDTVSIAKIYDVVDLQLGGRNLLLNSGTPVTNTTYNIKKYDLAIKPTVGEQYTITIKGKLGDGKTSFSAYNSGGNVTLGALTRVGTSDIYQKTFNWTNGGREDLDISVFIYAIPNSVTTESTIEWIKLEKGNKATDWSPAPEDVNNITFQIYAPNGYLLTNDLQSLTLQTFAYEGSIEIASGAIFQWSHLIDDIWTDIAGATDTTLTVTKSDVLKAKSYRCIMTYKSKTYTSTITVQDKTDTYNSIMCISSNAKGAECYWVLHTLVYSDTSEIDPLLGPISINAPESPVNGDYWYAVDSANATVQLKKYNGTAWVNSTDKQSLTYLWNIVNDGSDKTPIGGASKVQVVSCRDFTATATLMCDVSNEVDGILTQSSLSITDASDPIVSQTEPTSAVDGQIWIKPNTNGSYNMFLWSKEAQSWIPSDMDTRNKVYTSKPSSYSKGDIWITESDTAHSKYLEGTLLQATKDSETYNENDWSSTLKYDKDIDEIKGKLYDLSQYVTITSSGLKIGAVNSNDELSPFTSLFTSTELAFYQNSDKLLTLANNQLTAPRIVVEEELEVDGKISLGNLQITIESNGSFSFAVTK